MSTEISLVCSDLDDDAPSAQSDQDSLHILPLSIIPLATVGLRKARLIKNSRLEGIIELYSGTESGSGQISPDDLGRTFQFHEGNRKDLDVIQVLSPLPSYDVYSLRIELRRLGIAVDHHASLQLSEDKKRSLAGNMRQFTQPLISSVFGDANDSISDMADITALFSNPDKGKARNNLMKMSQTLNVEITAIPEFLQTYGDVYLSLAYYQHCLDQHIPHLKDLLQTLSDMRNDRQLKSRSELMVACRSIEKKLKAVVLDIKNILEIFKIRTADMWENVSTDTFSEVEKIITTYQTSIGGALCAITVKMNAWNRKFPDPKVGSATRRAEFIMSDIRHGIEGIPEISYVG